MAAYASGRRDQKSFAISMTRSTVSRDGSSLATRLRWQYSTSVGISPAYLNAAELKRQRKGQEDRGQGWSSQALMVREVKDEAHASAQLLLILRCQRPGSPRGSNRGGGGKEAPMCVARLDQRLYSVVIVDARPSRPPVQEVLRDRRLSNRVGGRKSMSRRNASPGKERSGPNLHRDELAADLVERISNRLYF